MEIFFSLLLGALLGGGLSFFFLKKSESNKLEEEEKKLFELNKKILAIETEIKNKELELKETIIKNENKSKEILDKAKHEAREIKIDLEKEKIRSEERSQHLEKKEKDLDEKFKIFENQKEIIKDKEDKLNQALEEQAAELSKIAQLSIEEAKEELLKRVEKQAGDILLKQIEKVETGLKEDANKKAQNIISQAIQKYAADVATDKMTTIVELPNDEMKGRIIGREGRNINTIEQVTGVDIIVDDTPNAIMISGFDLLRRYIAKTLIERLIEDGRIHPARIEELANKVLQETNELIKDFGEKTALEMGISGLNPDLIKILGRLHFRTSYGQNQLKHSKEVGYIAELIASQIGINPEKAKLAGVLHDIGKAVDHEIEGGHAEIGYAILKKYGIDEEIAKAVGSHHEDFPIETPLGFIICAADAISSARPGARKESIEGYLKRLRDLENIANSFEGVEQSYAIQAGREVRVIVNPEKLDDYQMKKLALNISQKIENDLNYPGQIKIHVIREKREIEFAK